MTIGILGMGGVGSFIGATLASHYQSDKNVRIIFICRNETKEVIQRDGLCLQSGDKKIIVHPSLVSDDPTEIGPLDILFVTTKSFSLLEAMEAYSECVTQKTILIPLLNGLNAKQLLSRNLALDTSHILEGCIYVASNIKSPGIVAHVGGPGKIFFGDTQSEQYRDIENILVKGGLDAVYTNDIKHILWKKFLFVSPLATMTAALDITFGQLAKEFDHMAKLEALMTEVQALALGFDINLTVKDIQESLAMLVRFPFESKSSLQLDIENGNNKTEKESFVDFVITQGYKVGTPVHHYEEMNQRIIERTKGIGKA